jgi:hypothetical protein
MFREEAARVSEKGVSTFLSGKLDRHKPLGKKRPTDMWICGEKW